MPNKKLHKYDAPKAHHPGKLPQSNKFIGELTKARKAGKKSFNVDGKEYMVKMSGGGPHPKNMGYAERFSPENYSEKTKAMLYNAPAYYPNDNHDKKKNAAIEAAIKQKKTGKTDPTILRVIGDPEEMKKDIAKLDSMRTSFKNTKDSITARGKMSAKDRAKSVRDEFKDFFNN